MWLSLFWGVSAWQRGETWSEETCWLHKLEHWRWEGTQGTGSPKEPDRFPTALLTHSDCGIKGAVYSRETKWVIMPFTAGGTETWRDIKGASGAGNENTEWLNSNPELQGAWLPSLAHTLKRREFLVAQKSQQYLYLLLSGQGVCRTLLATTS